MGILNREVGEIELIPVAKGIASRWWVVLIAALIGTVAMWSQESDLSTTPSSTAITRIYESRDETSLLSTVGIDPVTVSPLPSFDNQVLQVQEQVSREKIAQETGIESKVTITRSEQRFSLLNTVEGDGKTKFTFLSVGTPTYTFTCVDSIAETCETAIDAYVAALTQVRKDSIIAGIQRIKTLLTSVAQRGSLDAQEKIVGLDAAVSLITGELALLSTNRDQYGGTITTVKKSTYGFGLVAGALIGLLIALQMTLVDKRIRSISQLEKNVERTDILGQVGNDAVTLQHVAAAIVARAHQASQSHIVLIPPSPLEETSQIAIKLNEITYGLGVSVSSQPSVALMSAEALVSTTSSYVLAITKEKSKTNEVVDTWSVLSSAQKTILGVILVDELH